MRRWEMLLGRRNSPNWQMLLLGLNSEGFAVRKPELKSPLMNYELCVAPSLSFPICE